MDCKPSGGPVILPSNTTAFWVYANLSHGIYTDKDTVLGDGMKPGASVTVWRQKYQSEP